jgi:hypothetical protein
MNWNPETQKRFDELRMHELSGSLDAAEQAELARLFAVIEAEEAESLAPGLQQSQVRYQMLREQLRQKQQVAEGLVEQISQQEQFITSLRQYLNELEQ